MAGPSATSLAGSLGCASGLRARRCRPDVSGLLIRMPDVCLPREVASRSLAAGAVGESHPSSWLWDGEGAMDQRSDLRGPIRDLGRGQTGT